MVGWWLIVSFLLSTGFRSALVAHLSVEAKTEPIDSFEDLLKKHNWGWGFEQQLLRGGPGFYFKYNPDPIVQRIYRDLEGIDSLEGLDKVERGGYSLLGSRNRIYSLIATYKSDKNGHHPFYFSKTTYRIASDLGLGFRKGVPFKRRFFQLINRLIEAGIIDLWIQDVIDRRVKESRSETDGQEDEGVEIIKAKDEDGRIVLRMTHLIGVFLTYLIGNMIALATLILEQTRKRMGNKENLGVSKN